MVASNLKDGKIVPRLNDAVRTMSDVVRHGRQLSKDGLMCGYRRAKPDGTAPYVWLTYDEVFQIYKLGIMSGQKTFIGILAKNRPEWIIWEQATYNNNNIIVPLYETLGRDACIYIINETELEVVILDNETKFPTEDDIATIAYTSGTTGSPKGVVLSHGNIIQTSEIIDRLQDVLISFLPLAHMFERLVETLFFMFGLKVGYYSGDVKNLIEDIKELKPTVVPLVPRVLNRIYKMWLVVKRLGVMRATLLDEIVFKKIRQGLGGRIRLMVTGSAPVAPEVLEFSRAVIGCLVLEGYGQTECVAECTLCIEADCSTGNVGIPVPCNMIKLVDVPELGYFTGEICVKGFNVFKGYYKNKQLTKETIDEDGWLHTGDIGKWTTQGTLRIIDRKKHIFKLSQGEYIAPEKIEAIYVRAKYVAQIFVYGESLKTCIIAIVVPELMELAAELNIKETSFEKLCKKSDIKAAILNEMTNMGKLVKDIYLSSTLFSIENDQLTPTLKNKRNKLKQHFSSELAKMYAALD
ncbi:unnamed protein product [Dracunculus medinensis]|uniref:long-chain-fatty-acid--CoA ligase n=1 Tax=Dracunculus medinensis TaxID=318479 RepID=A0A3P7QMX7_DRAME|nr:unnamed protein product [Dracunculus medinensis]